MSLYFQFIDLLSPCGRPASTTTSSSYPALGLTFTTPSVAFSSFLFIID
jgi:hypothetical protein